MKKENEGITLIALVITIIVMLILVGVTVNVAMNGGLFNQARIAKIKTETEVQKETLVSALVGAVDNTGTLTVANAKKSIENIGATVTGDSFPLEVEYKELYFKIKSNGEIKDISTCNEEGPWLVENIEGIYTIMGYTGNETVLTIPDVYIDSENTRHNISAIGTAGLGGINYIAYLNADDNPPNPGLAGEGVLEQYIVPMNNVTSVTIPEGITALGMAAFGFTENLETVIIEGNITTAPDREEASIFVGSAVKNIIFSEGVTTIPQAICMETSLTSVSIPNSITEIGDHAFADVQCFENPFTLPTSIQTLEDACFQDTNIQELIVPSEVIDIDIECVAFTGYILNNIKVYGKNLDQASALINNMVYNGSYTVTDMGTYIEFVKN